MGRLNGPSVAPSEYVKHCKTYREAVRMAWQLRRVAYMTQRQLAAEAGLWPQMVTDYLNKDDAPTRRNLPAEKIPAFEAVVGNTVLTQWLAAQSSLTVMEETIANKEAA
jgi:transcriptional regulator with XRE-family HTH domain